MAEAGEVGSVPGVRREGPTDPVGAGDSMIAGIAAALASGHTPLQAARFGTIVAAITVQRLGETCTASPDEIRALAVAL